MAPLAQAAHASAVPIQQPELNPTAIDREVLDHLERIYWWAYVRPWAVRMLDRSLLINLILCGWYGRLREATLRAFGTTIAGTTLQISCCYGNLTPSLYERISLSGGTLDVLDILPVQLENLARKLPAGSPVRLHQMNALALQFPDASFDQVLLFFLLHEQPQEHREKTMREALRVLKPDGRIIVVDYGVPRAWHPIRFLILPLFGWLEPTARELRKRELRGILPREMAGRPWRKISYCGGLYQVLVSV